MLKENNKINNVILSETKNLMRSFTNVQDDNQHGRSMVEMLGVLAVIGVLSVAGIAGYTTAMNKHRANELLSEASKRATIVAMQVAQGRTGSSLSVAEFGDNSWNVTTYGLTNQFGIVGPSVSADVCKQVVNAVGTGTIVKKVLSGSTDATGDASKCGDAVVTLVYNDDMSTTDLPVQLTAQDPVSCSSNAQCGSDEECIFDVCRPKCPNGTVRMTNDTYCITLEDPVAYESECNTSTTENCCQNGYEFSEGGCCKTGYTGVYLQDEGKYLCGKDAEVCTNGAWNASGTAYCVNGQWKTKKDFNCGDTANPWSCTKRNKYACDPFGQNCTCFNGSEYRDYSCSGGGSSGY